MLCALTEFFCQTNFCLHITRNSIANWEMLHFRVRNYDFGRVKKCPKFACIWLVARPRGQKKYYDTSKLVQIRPQFSNLLGKLKKFFHESPKFNPISELSLSFGVKKSEFAHFYKIHSPKNGKNSIFYTCRIHKIDFT